MSPKSLEIQRAIISLEFPFPKDDLITCYRDFLNVRDFLVHYQYNPKVYVTLLDLTINLWDSKIRISRMSLLELIKRYDKNRDKRYGGPHAHQLTESIEMTEEIKSQLFILFKHCMTSQDHFTVKQLEEARKICNYMLITLTLKEDEVEWLCDNAEKSEMIVNRILRYPEKSATITRWAKQNFENDLYRHRRAELIGWLIDETPDFTIDKNLLIDDFEYFNIKDLKAIDVYREEKAMQDLIDKDLNVTFQPKEVPRLILGGEDITPKYLFKSEPELKLSKRFYTVHIMHTDDYTEVIPDFESMRDIFYANVAITLKVTMLWGIQYSRLDIALKTELMKKYYSKVTYRTFFKICCKNKMLDLLKWLREQIDPPKAKYLSLF